MRRLPWVILFLAAITFLIAPSVQSRNDLPVYPDVSSPVVRQHKRELRGKQLSTDEKEAVARLVKKAANSKSSTTLYQQAEAWINVLHVDLRNGPAHLQLGLIGLACPDWTTQSRAVALLVDAFDADLVDDPITSNPMAIGIAGHLGRWKWQHREFEHAKRFLTMAHENRPHDLCYAMQHALLLDTLPRSIQAADESMEHLLKNSNALLEKIHNFHWKLNEELLAKTQPGADQDPYVHCMLSMFHVSFYYRADVAKVTNAYYQIATAVWPQLKYAVPSKYNNATKKPCRQGKIRLGIASGALQPNSSVVCDFSGVLKRLDRNKFDITYIYFNERLSMVDPFVYEHESDKVFVLTKNENDTSGAWVTRHHKQIQALDLDILYYLDLTMSTHAHRTAMAKLAEVQVVSHGHPITSGIPNDTMNYYISWGAAELEHRVANKHYTEELVLLPKDTMHQYYEPRATDKVSLQNGLNYRDLVQQGRTVFGEIPARGHWYTCMQKPFKVGPEMAPIMCNILAQDPLGRIILHKDEMESNNDIIRARLVDAGCDMERIHLLVVQPHHRLLALYKLSHVILDSYPAGGCTTTREVLEMGKAVVTLPARLLGGRWSFAYYQMMGDATLNKMVIAETQDQYVSLAVKLGTDDAFRQDAEKRIVASFPNLLRRWESVAAWENVLMSVAPVRLASEDSTCPSHGNTEL